QKKEGPIRAPKRRGTGHASVGSHIFVFLSTICQPICQPKSSVFVDSATAWLRSERLLDADIQVDLLSLHCLARARAASLDAFSAASARTRKSSHSAMLVMISWSSPLTSDGKRLHRSGSS